METNYNEYYKKQLERGLEFQDFVGEILYKDGFPLIVYASKKYQNEFGENKAGLEIKFDDRYKTTGNLYIETAEKAHPSRPNYIPSGIEREDNTWLYAIGDYDILYVFCKTVLRLFRKECRAVQTETSQGFLLPQELAQKIAAKIIVLKK